MGRMKEGLGDFFESDGWGGPSGVHAPLKPPYPQTPGFKEIGTSREAAEATAPRVRKTHEAVLGLLRDRGPLTADEIAAGLSKTVLYVRPRVAELRSLGKIRKVEGARGRNVSGLSAAKWEAVP